MMHRDKMKVNGMTCGGCANSVRLAIEAVKGVSDVNVDLKDGVAEFLFDDTFVDPRVIANAIDAAGYQAVA